MADRRQPDDEQRHDGRSGANLGQKKAEREKASDEQLSHMEGGKAADIAKKKKEESK